jgi:hypothetical protein
MQFGSKIRQRSPVACKFPSVITSFKLGMNVRKMSLNISALEKVINILACALFNILACRHTP